jgi:leucyl aminopeptidase
MLQSDPLWRLPLWSSYRKQLDSKVADLSNVGGEAGQAGAITAALFLQEFAKAAPAWVHVDTAAWVSGGSVGPGRPEGGEALGLRALWRFLQDRFSE